jgi:hypothetical protein
MTRSPKIPVTENQDVLKGSPVKAFQYQDHQAHIQVHMSAMQDPIIMQLIGQNPQAQMLQAAMMAHIAEHVGYGYRQKIEQQLGMALPPEDEKLPPEIEIALSGMMAQAAQQVLQQNKASAAQEQAATASSRPRVADAAARAADQTTGIAAQTTEAESRSRRRCRRVAPQRASDRRQLELEGMKVAIDMQAAKAKLAADQERAGVQMGIDIAKSRADAQTRGNQKR